MANENEIFWLQLSDLHIFDSSEWNLMKKAYDFLPFIGKVRFVVVTGDLHNFGDCYDKTISFLTELCSKLKIHKTDVFIVPGNHDSADFADKKDFIGSIDRNIIEDQDCYHPYINDEKLGKSFSEYMSFINSFYGSKAMEFYPNPTGVFIKTWRNKLNILHLNTAWISNGDNTRNQIVDIRSVTDMGINNKLPTIAIAHHHFSALHGSHQASLRRSLINNCVRAYLCGDLHELVKDSIDDDTKVNSNIPIIVTGKATSKGDKSNHDVAFVLHKWFKNKVTVHPYIWSSKDKKFLPFHIWDINNKPLHFYLYGKGKNHISTSKKSIRKSSRHQAVLPRDTPPIWLPDAEHAHGTQTRFSNVTRTRTINNYLMDDHPDYGIASVKGIGKTFILQVKRAKISNKHHMLPKCITPSAKNHWGTESIEFTTSSLVYTIGEFSHFTLFWKYSIVCYVINQYKTEKISLLLKNHGNNGRLTDALRYCDPMSYNSLAQIINSMLLDAKWEIYETEYTYLTNLCSILLSELDKPVAIFIDKVDQALQQNQSDPPTECRFCEKSRVSEKCENQLRKIAYCSGEDASCKTDCCFGCDVFVGPRSNAKFKYSINQYINTWQSVQLSLLYASYTIKHFFRANLKVFFTIRHEALISYEIFNDISKKVLSNRIDLQYDRETQHRIFVDCIGFEADEFLYSPSDKQKAGKEEYAFVGIEKLCHPYVDKNELLFDSLYRHSFGRTRDIQEYGKILSEKLSELRRIESISEREERVKKFIELKAGNLVIEYIGEKRNIVPNHWTNMKNVIGFLCLIERNLLFRNDIINVCSKINKCTCLNPKITCEKADCKRHPFSFLYNIGLLGIIKNNENNEMKTQQIFKMPEEISYFVEKDDLFIDDATVFILHPALTKYLDYRTRKIKHFSAFILGNGIEVEKKVVNKLIEDHNLLDKKLFDNRYFGKNEV